MASVAVRTPSPALVALESLRDNGKLCVHIPSGATKLAGFRKWVKSDGFPEHVRVTFVDGEIYYDMSDEESETHNKPKAEVGRVLLTLSRRLKQGTYYVDGVLLTNVGANVSNNPDGTYILFSTAQSKRVRKVSREGAQGQFIEFVGTPDWVLEILSNSSVRKDTRQLRAAYHRAGISEYWLIDARGDEIDFQILVWKEGDYKAAPRRGGWQWSPVFQREFRLLREPNAIGEWDYTLQVRKAAARRKRKP
jgi:Uma2 family endonuclease